MLRFLVWLSTCALWVYALDRLDLWREAAGVALTAFAIFWTLGGAVWVLASQQREKLKPRVTADQIALGEHEALCLSFGEPYLKGNAEQLKRLREWAQVIERTRAEARR